LKDERGRVRTPVARGVKVADGTPTPMRPRRCPPPQDLAHRSASPEPEKPGDQRGARLNFVPGNEIPILRPPSA